MRKFAVRVAAFGPYLGLSLLGFFPILAHAKEPSITAIELYDGANGPAYIQLNNVLLNGKIELRQCLSADPLDKATYGRLQKVTLSTGAVLERGQDGALRYSLSGSNPFFVVPVNLKFERKNAYTLSELIDEATLSGTPAGPASDGSMGMPAPIIKRGVKLVFVAAPDVELAEFMLGERASTIPVLSCPLSGHGSHGRRQARPGRPVCRRRPRRAGCLFEGSLVPKPDLR